DAQAAKTFDQCARPDITSAASPNVPRNRRDELKSVHKNQAGRQSGPFQCWLPGLFLSNDCTGPVAAMQQGRLQEPGHTTRSQASLLIEQWTASLPPSSFGPRYGKGNSKNPSQVHTA